jgi:hypothetical protein
VEEGPLLVEVSEEEGRIVVTILICAIIKDSCSTIELRLVVI